MATVVTDKALNICTALMQSSLAFMTVVETLLNKKSEKEGAGIDLTDASIEEAIDNSPLKHADGVDFNNVMASIEAIKTFMDAGGHTGVFDKVRP